MFDFQYFITDGVCIDRGIFHAGGKLFGCCRVAVGIVIYGSGNFMQPVGVFINGFGSRRDIAHHTAERLAHFLYGAAHFSRLIFMFQQRMIGIILRNIKFCSLADDICYDFDRCRNGACEDKAKYHKDCNDDQAYDEADGNCIQPHVINGAQNCIAVNDNAKDPVIQW